MTVVCSQRGGTRSLLLLVSMEGEGEIYASILFRTPVSMGRMHDCPMKLRISRKPEAKYIATVGGSMENKDPRVLQSDWRIQS